MPRPHRPHHPPIPALEWAREISDRTPRTTAVGSSRILIENHTGILDFSEELVRLSTVSGPISISGCGLTLCEVRQNALMIRGRIRRVDYPEDGGEL